MQRRAVKFPALLAFCCLMAAALLPARALGDQIVYDDALENGWQNYSWCTVNFSAANYVHSGAYSAQVTYTGAWQGFYLDHAAFDTTPYTSLTFWINGGAASGQSIQVAALLNGTAQVSLPLNNYITGGSVAAGTWRQVTIPLSALGVANQSNMTGFWLQEDTGNSQPSFYVDDIRLVATPPPPVIHLNVNAGQTVRTVDNRLFGVNTAVWDSSLNTATTISLLQAGGLQILRFPGGSTSDGYHWQTNTSDNNTWTWASNFDAFAAVATGAKTQAFLTVNYGTGTAQEAA